MAIRPYSILPTVLLACAVLGPAHAAELGDARVLSHIGQPLAAEVELTLVEDAARPVQAHLARPDVYRGANIAMPPVLSSLDIAVIRQGRKQFLRLASLKPVESKHLHVYLELVDGGQRSVRLVTLWLTPDPNPAPPPAPVPAPVALLAAAPMPLAPAPSAPLPPPRAAAPEPVVAAKPAHPPAPPKRRPAPAAAEAEQHATRAEHAKPVKRDAKSAAIDKPGEAPACAPAPSAAEVNACTALGAKNAALRYELGQLEGRVKVLQVAAGVKPSTDAETVAKAKLTPEALPEALPEAHPEPKPEAHAEARPEAHAEAKPEAHADARPKSAPRIHRKPKPAAPPEEPLPWLAIGGALAGVLALAGLAVLLLRRRRAAAGKVLAAAHAPEVVVLPQDGNGGGASAKPTFISTVKARLMAVRIGKKPAQAAPAAAEPVEQQPITQPE